MYGMCATFSEFPLSVLTPPHSLPCAGVLKLKVPWATIVHNLFLNYRLDLQWSEIVNLAPFKMFVDTCFRASTLSKIAVVHLGHYSLNSMRYN